MTTSSIENPMPPLWLMYPHIQRGSIGWRMGYGEDYSYRQYEWFSMLSDTEKVKYYEMFPAPRTWIGYYDENFDLNVLDNYFFHGVSFWNKHGEMRLTKDWLVSEQEQGKKFEYVFFWKPSESVQDCLGQWQPSDFAGGHLHYSYAEQYMMAEKARVFKDMETHKYIMEAKNPKEMKALGQKVCNFANDVWDKVKYSIVLNGNYFKFSQNKEMRDFLLSTGDKVLVEASPLDKNWGIGIAKDNIDSMNPAKWQGQNLLGFALMEVRDELRVLYKNYNKIDWSQFSK